MQTFIITNFGMGRPVETFKIEAWSYDEALRWADTNIKGAHGLPGSSPRAAAKSRVVGIKRA